MGDGMGKQKAPILDYVPQPQRRTIWWRLMAVGTYLATPRPLFVYILLSWATVLISLAFYAIVIFVISMFHGK